MKDIAHHAQRTIVRQGLTARQACRLGLLRLSRGRNVEPLMSPDNHIVGQAAQQHQHVLGFKTLLVAFGQADAFVAFEAGLDPSSSLVVEGDQSSKHCLIRKRANQYAHAPLTIGFARANRHPTNRTHTIGRRLSHPSDLPLRHLHVGDPFLDRLSQQTRLLSRTGFAQHLIALREQPIHVGCAPPASVDAHQGPASLLTGELQRVLSGGDQRLQGGIELAIAGKQAIDHHFLIACRQDPSQLPPAPIACLIGKVAFGGKGGLLAAEPAAHIDIEHLPVGSIVVSIASAVLAIDVVHGLLHLGHIGWRTAIERLLHHRLLRAMLSPKGARPRAVRSQARIDFDHAMRSCQQSNEAIIELVAGGVFHRLLGNVDQAVNGFKHVQLLQLDSQSCQTRGSRKMTGDVRDTLVHGEAPPNDRFNIPSIRYESSPFFWQVLSLRKDFAANLDKNWVSKMDRLRWLDNFLFIMPPDLLRLHKKILEHCALDQQCIFLLSAPSGMGKTTYLNWLAALNLPGVEEQRRLAPVVMKVDAPLNGTLRTLLQRMLLVCGAIYLMDDSEEDLLLKLDFYRQQSNVRLIIVDDAEHIPYAQMRNYLRHISSVVHDIPIICASTNPGAWAGGYKEIVGSWTDYVTLPTYTGERLRDLLVFIETLLPFTKESGLFLAEVNVGTEVIDGPAKLIEKWTGGTLRDVIMLLRHASRRAIEDDLPCLSPQLLEEAWKELQIERVENFF